MKLMMNPSSRRKFLVSLHAEYMSFNYNLELERIDQGALCENSQIININIKPEKNGGPLVK